MADRSVNTVPLVLSSTVSCNQRLPVEKRKPKIETERLLHLRDPRTTEGHSYRFHQHCASRRFGFWTPQAPTGIGKMPKQGKRGRKETDDSGSKSPKQLRPELPGTDDREPDVVQWSDLSYGMVWDIFGHLSTMQKLEYRRVSSTWNDIQLKHISTSPEVKLDCCDLKHWKTIFCPPARETRRAMVKREVKLVTDKTRWVIMDFQDRKLKCHGWNSIFNLKYYDSSSPLRSLTDNHPQVCHILLSKMEMTSSFAMLDYQCLQDLGCSPELSPTVMVYESNPACYPTLWPLEEPRLVDEMKALRASWPRSIRLDGGEKDYWGPLRDLYMAYWPYPPNQLQWMEECITKIPTNDRLFDFLETVSYRLPDYVDFDEKTVLHFYGQNRERSVLAICASYLNIHRSRLNLPPPPHALT